MTVHSTLSSSLAGLPATLLEMLLASAMRWVHAKPRQRRPVIDEIYFPGLRFGVLEELSTFECAVSDKGTCTVSSSTAANSSVLGTGSLQQHTSLTTDQTKMKDVDLSAWSARCTEPVPNSAVLGLSFAEAGEAVSRINNEPEQEIRDLDQHFHVAPAVVEALLCVCTAASTGEWEDSSGGRAIASINQMALATKCPTPTVPTWIHACVITNKGRCAVLDAALYDQIGNPILTLRGVRMMSNNIAVPPALPSTPGSTILKQCATDVGILAIEYYAPDLCVRAADIETFHGVQGQYTIGRGQENVTFCSDDEDAVSMAMTSFQRLMKRCGLGRRYGSFSSLSCEALQDIVPRPGTSSSP